MPSLPANTNLDDNASSDWGNRAVNDTTAGSSYRALMPDSGLPHERQLFLCDMAVLIDLIQTEQPQHRLERLALLAPLAGRA
jgi:hypothetical protein